MESVHLFTLLAVVAHFSIMVGLGLRVVLRPLPVGVTFAWLTVILAAPFLGAAVYVMVGESRVGERRLARVRQLHGRFLTWLARLSSRSSVDWSRLPEASASLNRLALAMSQFPTVGGNRLEVHADTYATFSAIVADIDRAEREVNVEIYIWFEGGAADLVVEALLRARERRVVCRVLADAMGSRHWLAGSRAQRLRAAGVLVQAAFPVRLWNSLSVRLDHRIHRKIILIDARIAFTGSMNLVDPALFPESKRVGQWIDCMLRVQGPAVEALTGIFVADWEVETGHGYEHLAAVDAQAPPLAGEAAVQVVPSGPGVAPQAIHRLLLATIYSARRELVITSPYFVPDDAIRIALATAALRGVDVLIIVPDHVNGVVMRFASEEQYDDLLDAGVRMARSRGGLLHTKSITVDGQLAVVGSVNFDMRSLWLNFEVSLFIYNSEVTAHVRALQASYAESCTMVDRAAWQARSGWHRLAENLAALVGPLL